MRTRISLMILLVAMLSAICRASEPSVDFGALRQIVNDKAALVMLWESAARTQILLTIAGIIFGGLITILQTWGSTTWCKVTTGILGVATAVVTGVISKAPVSYTSYEKSVLQARAKISALNDTINFLKTTSDPVGQNAFKEEFTKTVREINQIQFRLSGDDKPVAFLRGPIGVVYAQARQSTAPRWVSTVPTSFSDWYFRGEAENPLLVEAKANSLQDALEQCAKYLLSQAKGIPIDAARQYAKSSTTVADTSFTYDGQRATYRYYTLLRLDKSLTRPDVVATLSVQDKDYEDLLKTYLMTMNKMGESLERLPNGMEDARRSFEQALKGYRELARKKPDTYLPYVATTLNNLGNLDFKQSRMEEARQEFEQALKIRRELASKNPDTYLPAVAMTLNNLGELYSKQNRMEEARQAFEQALAISRELASKSPDTYLPAVAMTLYNLGNLDREQNRRYEARHAFEEAVGIYQRLAERDPEQFRTDVARLERLLKELPR